MPLVIGRIVDGKLVPLSKVEASLPIELNRNADAKETLAVLTYPDGRSWEVRVHHRNGVGGTWYPTVWLRMRRE